MSSPGGEDEGEAKSPRSRSPVMGVAGLLRDYPKQTAGGGVAEEEGRRGSGGGILKLDPTKHRRSSAASVEFRTDKDDPSSPCPSDRLSVTWADGERSVSSDGVSLVPRGQGASPDQPSINTLVPACGSLLEESPTSPTNPPAQQGRMVGAVGGEDEEYGASVSAILRRASCKGTRRSTRRKKKMRRTSTMTTSSGETVVEVEGLTEEEEVAETLRIHKEVLAGVKHQPWPIARKLRLVRAAREYIRRHEGEMEERLAQSRSTRDVFLRCFIRARRVLRAGVRAVYVWVSGLEPWQGRIKTIESHFGSAVASYFTFLRWVLGLNLVLMALLAAFVIIPEFLAGDRSSAGERKSILAWERISAHDFKVLWDFEGILRYSPIFYGYYSKTPYTREGYRLPLAYFLTSLAVYAYSFVAILRKMAANSRMSKLAEDEECTFTWRLLAGWDYTIGNPEAAQNKVAAINTGFREALLEARESEKEEKSWRLRGRRVLAHLIVVLLIVGSAYAVVLLVKRSEDVDSSSSWWRQNELTITLTLISLIYPNLFDLVGLLELRHPRNQLQWQLARIMSLNLLNLYTLIFALFSKVDDMTKELGALKDNLTTTYSQEMTMQEATLPWPFNITSDDLSHIFEGLNSTYDLTTSLLDSLSAKPVTDILSSVSSALPSLSTLSPDAYTYLNSQDPLASSFAHILATSLLTALPFTKLPLPKGDPRLQVPPPPGCYLVQTTCLTSTSSKASTPLSTHTASTSPTTDTSTASTPPFYKRPPLSTLGYSDWARVIYGSGNEDVSYYGEEPVYLGEDNVTTVDWLSTPQPTQEPGMNNKDSSANIDSNKTSNTAEFGENNTVTSSTPNSSFIIDIKDNSSSLPSDAPLVMPLWGDVNSSGSGSDNTEFAMPEKQPVGLDNMSSNVSDVFDIHSVRHLNDERTPEPPVTPETFNTSESLRELPYVTNDAVEAVIEPTNLETLAVTSGAKEDKKELLTNIANNTDEASPELPKLETSTVASDAKTDEKEENFSNLMRLAPGIARTFFMLGNLEEEMDDADNALNSEGVLGVRQRNKREGDAVKTVHSSQTQMQHRENQEVIKYSTSVKDDQRAKEERLLENSNATEYKKKKDIIVGVEDNRIQEGNEESLHNTSKASEYQEMEHITVDRKQDIEYQKAKKETSKELKENQSLHRVKRVINDYGGLGVNDAYYLPLYHPTDEEREDDFVTYDRPPEDFLSPVNLDSNITTEGNTTVEYPKENETEWGTKMIFPTMAPYNISTVDRNAFWAKFTRPTTEGSGGGATLEPAIGVEENVTSYESAGNFSSLESESEDEECFITVCEEEATNTAEAPTTDITTPTSTITTTPIPATTTTTTLMTTSTTTTTAKPTSTHPFLVQPMQNNPEKWVSHLPPKSQERLRKLCWETMFGQEIIKLTVMDLVVTVVTVVMTEYVRAVVVRLFNSCCCWDLEKQFPGYADFKIAENILHLVNNQGMVWMGMFFAPGLPLLNTFKLLVLLYVRSWAVVTSNVPPETVFKASNNNNFYLLFLLTMLFLCTLPVGYAVVWLEPSWHCGPFSDYPKIYQLATSTLIGGLPPSLYPIIDYISSPGVVIPAGLLLILIIYYLISLTAALREANSDLRDQLRQERSAEKRKALDARSGKGRCETPTSRWGRVVPLTPIPRPRLDATSDPEKTAVLIKKPHSALSPEGENGPIISLCDPPKVKDEGPWPDDVTDLGHSEVFDDSLSESRQVGKEKVRGEGASERHEKERERMKEYPEKEREQETQLRGKLRKNSFPTQTKEEDDISLSRVPRGRQKSYGSQTRGHRLPQERKQSDESLHRDSPTKPRSSHRQYVDSPRERRRSSGSHPSKVKHKVLDEVAQEPNTTQHQQEASKAAKTHRGLAKRDSDKLPPEPETPTKGIPPVRHRREPSILKMEDLRRSSNGQQKGGAKATTSGHHCSSSDDSQGMQTIPVIKISKEDSVERSLQQAKLQRQDKTQDEADSTDTTRHPSHSPDTTSRSSNTASPQSREHSGSNNVEQKTVPGKGEASGKSKKYTKPAPIETNLDDPYLPDSDTVALIDKGEDEIVPLQLAVEEETGILSSDEESTLLEK